MGAKFLPWCVILILLIVIPGMFFDILRETFYGHALEYVTSARSEKKRNIHVLFSIENA